MQTNAVLVAILPESVRKKVQPLSDASEISKRTHHFGDGTGLQLLDALIEAPPPIFNPIVGQDGILPPIANRQSRFDGGYFDK